MKRTPSSMSDTAIVLVICPLVSLMQDQVSFLKSKGIRAAYIGEEQCEEHVKRDIEYGKFQIVYGSPESFLQNQRWRKMLATKVYRENVKLIAVDEAHCISHWGFTPRKGDKIFRVWFSRINELRSIVPAGVPLLALTAIATKRTRERVMHALEMKDATVIKDNPNRPNITYSVQIVGNKTFETFQPLITQVELLGATCDRVIIYCQTIKITTMIYAHFQAELAQNMYKDKIEDPKNRIVEMFHARIDELNKNHILASFAHENGCIRVLIATIAYGMGIDCKAVKTIIHYGPSRNLEAYLQESGRAGRDQNSQCQAIMLYNNVMLKYCDEHIVAYCRNDTECRRTMILNHFDNSSVDIKPPKYAHVCCDICLMKCNCDSGCHSLALFSNFQNEPKRYMPRMRNVNDDEKLVLASKLDYLKQYYVSKLINSNKSLCGHLLTPSDFVCSFSDIQKSQVLRHCTKLFTLQDIYSYIDIWEPGVADDIFFIMHLIFGDVDYKEDPNSNDHSTEMEHAEIQELMNAWLLTSDDEFLFELPDEFNHLSDED